ncbi:serine hydrolase domain-containing protein [Streptacidiphilus jiangxiensis]|uniref:serine hydrolase domain-containing protein n=1 Tax=Streptacidiphilus jiangxiensis TaxID=235985 RepID=UPI001377B69A|nr:serine hydrolase domain-containing protein [Streptacidiphilus jiangxiensis]
MNGDRLQQALAELAQGRGPGVFALVTQDGEPVFSGCVGTADLARPRPIRAEDRFRVASVTKPYVAAVVLLLESEGVLRLDDVVERWLPGLVPDATAITVEHLLRMRSGLPDYVRTVLGDPLEPARLQRYFPPEELVGIALAEPDRWKPAAGWRYCNTDYVLLGLIVERATGRALRDLLQERVCEPLGLTATYLPDRELELRPPHVRGYLRRDAESGFEDVTEYTASEAWASGALVSTAAEVARFLDALLGGRLLPPEQLARMRDATRAAPDLDYGLGLMRYALDDGTVLHGHLGTHYGVLSYAFGDDRGRTVVIHQNCWDEVAGGVPRHSAFLEAAFAR